MRLITLCIALTTGCFAGEPDFGCKHNEHCASGQVCDVGSGACLTVCSIQSDCVAPQLCGQQGVCVDATGDRLPAIDMVFGNDPADPTQIVNGLTVQGAGLDAAIFELRDANLAATALTVTAQTDALAQVQLPADVRSGNHVLVATNASGSDQTGVQLLLPDLDGNEIVNRINNDATTPIAAASIVTGTAAGTIALGDHNHTAVIDARIAAVVGTVECPGGYTHDPTETTFTLCRRGRDEIVKVSDFWIDRYESVVVSSAFYNNGLCDGTCTAGTTCFGDGIDNYPSTFPKTGDWTTPLYSCSVAGEAPSNLINWFQASQACALSGKRLPANAEWQVAASGTADPGALDGTIMGVTACNTTGMAARSTGVGANCRSGWGAEDMIGNVEEWIDSWHPQIGNHGGGAVAWPMDAGAGSFPDDWYLHGGARMEPALGTDGSHLVRHHIPSMGLSARLPAALTRGGGRGLGIGAGKYSLRATDAPTVITDSRGFRCARSR